MFNTNVNRVLWNYYFLNTRLIASLNDAILNIRQHKQLIQDHAEQATEAACIHYSSNVPGWARNTCS